MRSSARLAALLALAAGLAACSLLPKPPTAEARSIGRGHALAERDCGGCHAVEPGGGVSRAPRAPPFASLEMRHTVALEGRLAAIAKGGHYAMPPVALSAAELTDLKAYMAGLDAR